MADAKEIIEEAYQFGLNRVQKGGPLGGSDEGCYFILPAAICEAYSHENIEEIPHYSELSEDDRFAMKILMEVIEAKDWFRFADKYPMLQMEIIQLGKVLEEVRSKQLVRSPETKLWSVQSKYLLNQIFYYGGSLVRTINGLGEPDYNAIASTPAIILSRRRRSLSSNWWRAPSWLGGKPKLGKHAWPRDSKQRPLLFVAQISLAQLAQVSKITDFPNTGSLAFFVGGNGAVVHVEGNEQDSFTHPPKDLPGPETFSDMGCAVEGCDHNGLSLLLYWPIEMTVVPETGDMFHDGSGEKLIHDSVERLGSRGQLSLEKLKEIMPIPRPQWWYTAIKLSNALRGSSQKYRAGATTHFTAGVGSNEVPVSDSDARSFCDFVDEIYKWAQGRDPWVVMTSDDARKYVALTERLRKEWRDYLDFGVRSCLFRGETETFKLILTAEDRHYKTIPEASRRAINEQHRLPAHGNHQMFGTPICIQGNAICEQAGKHCLLQFCDDDMINSGNDNGTFQFWISPRNLKSGNWSATSLTWEGT